MQTESSLRKVLMIFRHGDRSPTYSYPNDPHINYKWPGGLGALTTTGAEQMVLSAKDKASRYRFLVEDLIGNVDFGKVCVLSSHVQRCVVSVKHFLNGFFNTTWPDNLIHVIPREEDEFLASTGKSFFKYLETFRDYFRNNQQGMGNHFKTPQDYQNFLGYVEKNTGWKMDMFELFTLLDDTLTVQLHKGLKLPEWTDSVYEEYLKPIGKFAYHQIACGDYMQTRSGVLLKDIINRLEQSSLSNIVLYSAHDITLTSLMIRMGVQISPRADYGSMFAVELHENPATEDGLEVKLLYYINFADQNPTEMKIPNCEMPSFKQFKEIMKGRRICNKL